MINKYNWMLKWQSLNNKIKSFNRKLNNMKDHYKIKLKR